MLCMRARAKKVRKIDCPHPHLSQILIPVSSLLLIILNHGYTYLNVAGLLKLRDHGKSPRSCEISNGSTETMAFLGLAANGGFAVVLEVTYNSVLP